MAKRELPHPDLLRQLLDYDSHTGALIWRERSLSSFDMSPDKAVRAWKRWNCLFSGKSAGTLRPDGYLYISVGNRPYGAHRIAWAIHFGQWPKENIDHLDGNRSYNAIVNMRDVSQTINCRNRVISNRNKSGIVGVQKTKFGTWRVSIGSGKNQMYLGSFKSIQEATLARKAAEAERNYSVTLGKRFQKAA